MGDFKKFAKLYFSSAFVYAAGLLFLRKFPFYKNYLYTETQAILLYLYLAYLAFFPVYYFLTVKNLTDGNRTGRKPNVPNTSVNKPYLILVGLNRFLRWKRLLKTQKVAFLFLGVKIFFLPLMINFFLENAVHIWQGPGALYGWALTLVFTLDTLIFGLGYSFEFPRVGNVVKSVEPTLLGWGVALVCYPPFNSFTGDYIPWGANDYAFFWNDTWTLIFRGLLLLLLLLYLSATFALGAKASNLTNRGIVSRFPYSIIRHPAYIGKVSFWWVSMLPVMSWPFALGMGFWTLIYFLRAVTEERHLREDPDYLAYCKKVKWKFIPGIW